MTERSFWYVFCVGGGAPTYKHDSQESAEREATRLAENLNREFLVLQAVAAVRPAPKTITVKMDGMPF